MLTRIRRLRTKKVENTEEIRAFFDACSHGYAEKHGHSQRLMRYRIGLIEEAVHPEPQDVVLDVGCGIGHYLMALARRIGHGIGIDFSDRMIESARGRIADLPWRGKLSFRVDNAEKLGTIPDSSVDIVMCIGAFEHMINRDAVLSSAHRVLKPGGRIVLMTPNGSYFWYRSIAPILRLDTRHLSTDRFLEGKVVARMLRSAGFGDVSLGCWTFIPKGDIHPLVGVFLGILDGVGKFCGISALRGGLIATARRGEQTNPQVSGASPSCLD